MGLVPPFGWMCWLGALFKEVPWQPEFQSAADKPQVLFEQLLLDEPFVLYPSR